ncbi:hypothetical protein D1227_03195 [Henriciella mobilis]|uniref:hypothetical protein n=1 Tax=Henriciella mobilis TaxID=2305467 RepID=UPI000E676671|nr:hypothetical protein [Henriciella mobilis]RIJ17830.1 hypothetical protein D1231_00460 [Henriciella mobilis]RIJ25357.1 hypothetical protein D1227_03195 [Henriciella mobilis]
MAEEEKSVDFGKLRSLMLLAVIVGATVLIVSLWQLGQFQAFEIGWTVMAVAFGAIAWAAVFYFGCLIAEGSLTSYIISDDTEIKGQNVEMVTRTRSSGDPRLDAWIEKFVFARNTFGLAVIPLLILGGLFLWG